MSMFKKTFEHRVFYNKHVANYKTAEDKFAAVNQIRDHHDLLADQESELTDQIAKQIEELKTIFNTPPGSPGPNERKHHALLKKGMEKIVTAVVKEVDTDNHIHNPSRTLETLQGVIEKSFDKKMQSFYPATKCINVIEEICRLGGRVAEFREKRRLMKKLIQEALNKDYPDSLTKMSPRKTDGKKQLRGATENKSKEKEDRQAKHYPKIIEEANKVIGNKDLSEFVTDLGNAKTILFENIFNQYKGVPKPTLRRWLDDDLKDGKFEKMRKKYSQK